MLTSPLKSTLPIATAGESFGIYIQQNNANAERKILLVEKGMTVEKIKKAAAKELQMKIVKRIFLFSGHEVKFVDEIKQDDEVFVSAGDDFYKSGEQAPTQQFNVSVLGDGGVGKSALTLRFIRGIFISQWEPTVEDAYTKAVTVDNKVCRLQILDTAGQDNFESMRPHWLKEKDGYVFMFSADNEQSFKELGRFIKLHKEINGEKKVPIILVANKIDIIRQDATKRKIEEERAKSLSRKLDAVYIETSALTGENVDAVFEHLIRLCRNEIKEEKPVITRCILS